MTAEGLRTRLRAVREAGGAAPADYWELTETLLLPVWLGHPDPELRDRLIYTTLATWLSEGVYDPEQLRRVLRTATDEEHLFNGFGAVGDERVLVRSFSVLLLPPALAHHRQRAVLEPREVRELAEPIERYLSGERDLRGHDVDLGWLHAAAHAADAGGALLACPELDPPTSLRLLDALRSAAATPHHVYAHGEDDRIAQAMAAGLGRADLALHELTAWLQGFRPLVHACADMGMPDGYARLINVNHTLRALYFLVRDLPEPVGASLAAGVDELLGEFAEL